MHVRVGGQAGRRALPCAVRLTDLAPVHLVGKEMCHPGTMGTSSRSRVSRPELAHPHPCPWDSGSISSPWHSFRCNFIPGALLRQ